MTLWGKTMDLVSVIIPLFNTGEPFRACIDSVVKQTYSNLEIIVVDDQSDDPLTLSILDEYRRQEPRIKVIRNEQNSGISHSRNVGEQQAQGKYFTFLDSDDRFVPEFVEKMVQALEQNHTDFAVCSVENFSDDPAWVPDINELKVKCPAQTVVNMHDFLFDGHLFEIPVVAYAKMFRRDVYQGLHLKFRDKLRVGEDTEWLLRCISQLNTFTVIDFLGIHRLIHGNSLCRKPNLEKMRSMFQVFIIKYEQLKRLGVNELYFTEFLKMCMDECFYASKVMPERHDQLDLFKQGMHTMQQIGYDVADAFDEAKRKAKHYKLLYKLNKLFSHKRYLRYKALHYANKRVADFLSK